MINDFTWPEHLMKGFVKKYPMLFNGGATSNTQMHFDMDMSHIPDTQFPGRKDIDVSLCRTKKDLSQTF